MRTCCLPAEKCEIFPPLSKFDVLLSAAIFPWPLLVQWDGVVQFYRVHIYCCIRYSSLVIRTWHVHGAFLRKPSYDGVQQDRSWSRRTIVLVVPRVLAKLIQSHYKTALSNVCVKHLALMLAPTCAISIACWFSLGPTNFKRELCQMYRSSRNGSAGNCVFGFQIFRHSRLAVRIYTSASFVTKLFIY